MSERILVAFASSEGHTAKIARHMTGYLRSLGHEVRLWNVSEVAMPRVDHNFDAAIVAASIHMGSYQDEIAGFVEAHIDDLRAKPSAFVSVSLSAASSEAEEREAANDIAIAFLKQMKWTPDMAHAAAGGVHNKRTGFFKRWMLRRVLRKKGIDMPASGDLEFTDWSALDAFVDRFRESLKA